MTGKDRNRKTLDAATMAAIDKYTTDVVAGLRPLTPNQKAMVGQVLRPQSVKR